MNARYLSGFEIDMSEVKEHYMKRETVSGKLRSFLTSGQVKSFAELAVGKSDPYGNFSASHHEYPLAQRILEKNSHDAIFGLGQQLADQALMVRDVPKVIYRARLPYLKIGVGSEIACLLQPDRFWVGNTRTIWSHLLVKHNGDKSRANEALELYRDKDRNSEMDYQIWSDIYSRMKGALGCIGDVSGTWAEEQKITPGGMKYLWIDAVCSVLYDKHHK